MLGVNVGLLMSPKTRRQEISVHKRTIRDLEKKIKKLTKQNQTQTRMIEILRVLPGNMHIKLGLDKKGKPKNEISKRAQGSSGVGAKAKKSRGSVEDSEVIESITANGPQLETKAGSE